MGMYTEFKLNVILSENTPKNIVNTINHEVTYAPDEDKPEDYCWKHGRWPLSNYNGMGSDNSFVQQPDGTYHLICNNGDLKDYEDEIQTFIDMIYPYVIGLVDNTKEWWAWKQYETDERAQVLIISNECLWVPETILD